MDHIFQPNAQQTKPSFRLFLSRKEVNDGGGGIQHFLKNMFYHCRGLPEQKSYYRPMLRVPVGLITTKGSHRRLSKKLTECTSEQLECVAFCFPGLEMFLSIHFSYVQIVS